MLYLLHNIKHGLTYTLDEDAYIVDTDDLVVEKTTFRQLKPYIDEGLIIANVYYGLDDINVHVSVTSITSILLTLYNSHLSCLDGELLFAYHSDEVVFAMHNELYTLRLGLENSCLSLYLNNSVYYYINPHRLGTKLGSWHIDVYNFFKWGSYIVITIALKDGLDTEMCLFRLLFKDFELVTTCTTDVRKFMSIEYLREETSKQKIISTKYKIRNLPY